MADAPKIPLSEGTVLRFKPTAANTGGLTVHGPGGAKKVWRMTSDGPVDCGPGDIQPGDSISWPDGELLPRK